MGRQTQPPNNATKTHQNQFKFIQHLLNCKLKSLQLSSNLFKSFQLRQLNSTSSTKINPLKVFNIIKQKPKHTNLSIQQVRHQPHIRQRTEPLAKPNCTIEICILNNCILPTATSNIGTIEISTIKIRPREITVPQICTTEICTPKVSPREIRGSKTGTPKITTPHITTVKRRTPTIKGTHIAGPKIIVIKVSECKVHPAVIVIRMGGYFRIPPNQPHIRQPRTTSTNIKLTHPIHLHNKLKPTVINRTIIVNPVPPRRYGTVQVTVTLPTHRLQIIKG
jgi:hypothetical protein